MIENQRMPILIPCQHCDGRGKRELPEHLSETLALVPKRGSVAAETVAEKLALNTAPVASNRLLDLMLLNLVTRKRSGKFWLYTRK